MSLFNQFSILCINLSLISLIDLDLFYNLFYFTFNSFFPSYFSFLFFICLQSFFLYLLFKLNYLSKFFIFVSNLLTEFHFKWWTIFCSIFNTIRIPVSSFTLIVLSFFGNLILSRSFFLLLGHFFECSLILVKFKYL